MEMQRKERLLCKTMACLLPTAGKTICEWAKMICFEDAFALGLLRNQSTSRVSAGN